MPLPIANQIRELVLEVRRLNDVLGSFYSFFTPQVQETLMNFLDLIRILLPFLIDLIGKLEECPECPECPPGSCDELRAETIRVSTEINAPGSLGLVDFIKCVDIARLMAAVQELVAVIGDAIKCGDGDNGEVCPPEGCDE